MAHIMTKQGSLDNVITYEHYCDTVADLSNIPLSQTTLGSVAIVVNDEDDGMGIYIANSQKEWTPISTSISGGGSGEVLLDLIHVCSSSEYDSTTKVPTIEDAESNKIYLVPNSESGNNAFDEWIYADEAWERFGGGSINVPVTDVQVNGVSVVTNGVANILTETENSVPIGGTTGQILTKTSNSNYDIQWANPEVSASEFDGLKNQIIDMSPITTVGPATYAITEYETPKGYFFADAAAYNAESVLVEINPVQEGSGDPTPDNVRPISGWTETTITHYGDKYDPDLITITFPSEAGTVYCGTLNVTNGELVVNSELVTVSSFSTYYGVSSHGFAAVTMNSRYTNRVPLDKINLMVGNQMKYSTGGWKTIPAYSYCGTELDPKVIVYVIPGVTTIYEANAWLASLETPLQVMLWLETPITYHLTPQEIKLARYVNELSADTGDVTLTYRQDVGLYESITRELVDEKVQDVQVNGTSVVSNGVAEIPVAGLNVLGVISIDGSYGITKNTDGRAYLTKAQSAQIKAGIKDFNPIVPLLQHESTFYGLAKAAGDSTQSASSNAVGTYTPEAKSAIQSMLGIDLSSIAQQVEIPLVETVTGTTPTITGQPNVRYVCGEVTSIIITPPSAGSIDVIFTSGSSPAVLTLPSTVSMPVWFDSTVLDANTKYEILITDGEYGSVMSWPI